jgi:hypothetical protein
MSELTDHTATSMESSRIAGDRFPYRLIVELWIEPSTCQHRYWFEPQQRPTCRDTVQWLARFRL